MRLLTTAGMFGLFALFLVACGAPSFAIPQDPLALIRTFVALNDASTALSDSLDGAAAAVRSQSSDLDSVTAALQSLCEKIPGAARCALLDPGRIIRAVAPADSSPYLGTVAHLWQATAPDGQGLACTQVYRAPEGYDALDAGVTLADGSAVAVTLQLGRWLDSQIAPVVAGLPVEIWIMQPDGLILYDHNQEEIGRNLFADPLYSPYPQLQELGKQIAAQEDGSGTYTFLRQDMQEPVEKYAQWQTLDFCGRPWRVVMAHAGQVRDDGNSLVDSPNLTAAQDALRQAAADPVLGDALATGDEAWGRTVFRALYDAYPDVYAIEYLDRNGVNQYGYPPENSLIGYDFRSLQSERDALFLEVLQLEHETNFDQPLLEGPTGHFFFVPVYRGAEYLGMIYLIQIDRQ